MSVVRSPTGSGISEPRSQSDTKEQEKSKNSRRNCKRKEPEEDNTHMEIAELRKQMDQMMTLLKTFTSNQEVKLKQISTDISSINSQICDIKKTTENIISEQNIIKTDLANLSKAAKTTEEKVVYLESDIKILKSNGQQLMDSNLDQSIKFENVISELQERNLRNKNIIVAGIPEPNLQDILERRNFDMNEVSKITQSISKDYPKPVKTIRLGKYASENCRPIKVFFAHEETAKYVLQNKEALESETIKIYSDRTPQQQIYLKTLKEELQQRIRNGETNLTIKYIKGTPKIITKSTPKNSNPTSNLNYTRS